MTIWTAPLGHSYRLGLGFHSLAVCSSGRTRQQYERLGENRSHVSGGAEVPERLPARFTAPPPQTPPRTHTHTRRPTEPSPRSWLTVCVDSPETVCAAGSHGAEADPQHTEEHAGANQTRAYQLQLIRLEAGNSERVQGLTIKIVKCKVLGQFHQKIIADCDYFLQKKWWMRCSRIRQKIVSSKNPSQLLFLSETGLQCISSPGGRILRNLCIKLYQIRAQCQES